MKMWQEESLEEQMWVDRWTSFMKAMKDGFKELTSAMNLHSNNKKDVYEDLKKTIPANKTW